MCAKITFLGYWFLIQIKEKCIFPHEKFHSYIWRKIFFFNKDQILNFGPLCV